MKNIELETVLIIYFEVFTPLLHISIFFQSKLEKYIVLIFLPLVQILLGMLGERRPRDFSLILTYIIFSKS